MSQKLQEIPFPAKACWEARGFSLPAWYAKNFGIRDQDIAEADWLADWVKRNHNRLQYSPIDFTWRWAE